MAMMEFDARYEGGASTLRSHGVLSRDAEDDAAAVSDERGRIQPEEGIMTELSVCMPRASAVAQRTILVVDDEPTVRSLIREIAQGLSIACQVYEAADGQSALEIAQLRQPDVVLLDIVLPGSSTSGVLVCQELCRNSRTKVVIVSGSSSKTILRTCLSMGATDCVRKPFMAEDLRSKLMTWLAD